MVPIRRLRLSPRTMLLTPCLIAALLVPTLTSASATTSTKPFSATLSPSSVAGGGSTTITLTLTNESSQQQLGSANLTAPSGFSVSSPAPIAGTNTVALRNLALAPGASAAIPVSVSTPCATGTYNWTIVAKQSNDFNGPPGNSFVLDASASSLTTTVTGGGCHLEFVTGRGPANASVGSNITSAAYNPTGPRVQVAVVGSSGSTVTASTAPITLSISANPGGGSLSPSPATSDAVAGIATFNSLSIDRHGVGYTLLASSPGITSATSSSFDVTDQGTVCTSSDCSVSAKSDTVDATVSTSNAAVGDTMELSLGLYDLDCAGYDEPPSDTLLFDYSGSAGKQVTYTIAKSVVTQIPDNGAAHFQVCYASTSPFTTKDGYVQTTISAFGTTYYAGVLPDCDASNPDLVPCVVSKNKTRAGAMQLTFKAPPGDPMAH